MRCEADERKGIEQLCRYITRPAIATERLSVNREGNVVLKLKTPWRNGTTHIVLKRVFDIDIGRCSCEGKLKRIAVIEEPAAIEKRLAHLGLECAAAATGSSAAVGCIGVGLMNRLVFTRPRGRCVYPRRGEENQRVLRARASRIRCADHRVRGH